MTFASELPAYSGAEATSPPTVGHPKQVRYQLSADTRRPTRRREVERDLRWSLRQPRLPLEEAAIHDEASEQGLEQQEDGRAAHRRLRRPLGVRHEPEHSALRVHDAGEVLDGPVGICGPGHPPVRVGVAEDDLATIPERPERLRIRVVLALAMGDRHG